LVTFESVGALVLDQYGGKSSMTDAFAMEAVWRTIV